MQMVEVADFLLQFLGEGTPHSYPTATGYTMRPVKPHMDWDLDLSALIHNERGVPSGPMGFFHGIYDGTQVKSGSI